MRAAAKLLEYGARPNEISDALGTHTRANIEMLGKVLQTLSFYNDGAVSTIEINSDLYDKEVNTDNFISFARYILTAIYTIKKLTPTILFRLRVILKVLM